MLRANPDTDEHYCSDYHAYNPKAQNDVETRFMDHYEKRTSESQSIMNKQVMDNGRTLQSLLATNNYFTPQFSIDSQRIDAIDKMKKMILHYKPKLTPTFIVNQIKEALKCECKTQLIHITKKQQNIIDSLMKYLKSKQYSWDELKSHKNEILSSIKKNGIDTNLSILLWSVIERQDKNIEYKVFHDQCQTWFDGRSCQIFGIDFWVPIIKQGDEYLSKCIPDNINNNQRENILSCLKKRWRNELYSAKMKMNNESGNRFIIRRKTISNCSKLQSLLKDQLGSCDEYCIQCKNCASKTKENNSLRQRIFELESELKNVSHGMYRNNKEIDELQLKNKELVQELKHHAELTKELDRQIKQLKVDNSNYINQLKLIQNENDKYKIGSNEYFGNPTHSNTNLASNMSNNCASHYVNNINLNGLLAVNPTQQYIQHHTINNYQQHQLQAQTDYIPSTVTQQSSNVYNTTFSTYSTNSPDSSSRSSYMYSQPTPSVDIQPQTLIPMHQPNINTNCSNYNINDVNSNYGKVTSHKSNINNGSNSLSTSNEFKSVILNNDCQSPNIFNSNYNNIHTNNVDNHRDFQSMGSFSENINNKLNRSNTTASTYTYKSNVDIDDNEDIDINDQNELLTHEEREENDFFLNQNGYYPDP